MNKVLEAAGRVIRTENDTGIAVLMDERFESRQYRALFPKEWVNTGIISRGGLEGIEAFWKSRKT